MPSVNSGEAGLWAEGRLTAVPALALLAKRLRSSTFWRVQGMVLAITLSHYLVERALDGTAYSGLHHIPVAFYVFPIIYASLRFGLEGGLLTGLWCTLLSAPNIVIWHRSHVEWLVELNQLAVEVVVGLVLSRLVQAETAEKQRAQELADRLALVNQEIIRAQEDERRHIARELHDDAMQGLVLVCRSLDQVGADVRLSNGTRAGLEAARAKVQEVLASVRRFSRDLRPAVLDDLGLVAAMEWLAEELGERQGISTEIAINGLEGRLARHVELVLFRVTQEALRNVQRHSGATRVQVKLSAQSGRISLVVRDNGRGFVVPSSSNELARNSRLGIVGMQERVRILGGSLTVESRPGGGTTVQADLNPGEGNEASSPPGETH